MKIFLGVLKEDFRFGKIKSELENLGLKVIKYFPKLRIVKFECKDIASANLPYFKSIEEERQDFTI